jgi:hypothetical protein
MDKIKQVAKRKQALANSQAVAQKALKRWKTLAQRRAASDATTMMTQQETRTRTELEAKRIQDMAEAVAKGKAKDAFDLST